MATSHLSTSFLLLPLLLTLTTSTTFTITNRCPYTLWPAALPIGGGRQLNPGQNWTISVNPNTTLSGGRIWARTNCSFDANGRGNCSTGDCNGILNCTSNGSPPDTLAEFALDQFNNMDLYDISIVDGFNVAMDFGPTASGCRRTHCTGDIVGNCPSELRVGGGCDSPCDVFKTDEYCCNSGRCAPTNYSEFFKNYCPEAYSIPNTQEGQSTLTCRSGTDYSLVFCP